jgi:protein-S-isoprenylcysteine O-methyltransferase Ste14
MLQIKKNYKNMKNKIISIVVFCGLAYALPLASRIDLLFTIQPLLLTLFAVILLATQPPLSIMESKEKKNSDKFSVYAILFGFLISQVFSIIEWAYFRPAFHQFSFDGFTISGISLVIAGTIFRVWSIRTLGKYFTATVQKVDEHKIITTGAYRILRHPSYTGAFLAVIGGAVMLHAYFGIAITLVVISAVYYYRIKVEEETLIKIFGDEYKVYRTKTKRMIPYIY